MIVSDGNSVRSGLGFTAVKNPFQSGCLFLHINRVLGISRTPYSCRSAKDATLPPLKSPVPAVWEL